MSDRSIKDENREIDVLGGLYTLAKLLDKLDIYAYRKWYDNQNQWSSWKGSVLVGLRRMLAGLSFYDDEQQ